MSYDLTLTEDLLSPLLERTSPLWHNSWEVGRLVLSSDFRGDQNLLKRCLFLTLEDLCNNESPGSLFASCSHVLSRLYRRFGFVTLFPKVQLAATEKVYALIHGKPDVVLNTLKNTMFSTHE